MKTLLLMSSILILCVSAQAGDDARAFPEQAPPDESVLPIGERDIPVQPPGDYAGRPPDELGDRLRSGRREAPPFDGGEHLNEMQERQRRGNRPGIGPPGRDSRLQARGAMHWLRRNYPEAFEELNRKRETNPHTFREEMREWLEKYARETNPEQYERFIKMREHEQKMRVLARRYHAANSQAEKRELKKKIRAELIEEFEQRQQERSKELEKLEERLDKYRTTLKKREKNKEQLIETEVKRLTEEPQAVE